MWDIRLGNEQLDKSCTSYCIAWRPLLGSSLMHRLCNAVMQSSMQQAIIAWRTELEFLTPCRALNGMQKKFGGNGPPIAPVRSRSLSRTASAKWAIRAASFTGSPFAGSKPIPGACE